MENRNGVLDLAHEHGSWQYVRNYQLVLLLHLVH